MKQLEAYELHHKGILALGKAEQVGLRLDLDYISQTKNALEIRIKELEETFYTSDFYKEWKRTSGGKININSDTQLARYLYTILKLTPAKTTESGQGSTDNEALKSLRIKELDDLLEIRKWKKVLGTYLEGFLKEANGDILHPFFNLHTVKTFRSSSDSPNFQNIPKRDKEVMQLIRKGVFPRKGNMLMEVDFSGLEVSISACHHKDPAMIEYLTTDADMHGDMTMQIFGLDKVKGIKESEVWAKVLRPAVKNAFIFPQFYGDYYGNNAKGLCEWTGLNKKGVKWRKDSGCKLPNGMHLSEHLMVAFPQKSIPNYSFFEKHLQEIEKHFWTKRFSVYAAWKDEIWKRYQKQGWIQSKTGFVFQGDYRRNEILNAPIQCDAFQCLLWCFIKLDEIIQKRGLQSKLVGQIHDAIVFDIYPEELSLICKLVKRVMTKDLPAAWDWINVPLSVEAELSGIDKSWAEVAKYKL